MNKDEARWIRFEDPSLDCHYCKHLHSSFDAEPCNSCDIYSLFECGKEVKNEL